MKITMSWESHFWYLPQRASFTHAGSQLFYKNIIWHLHVGNYGSNNQLTNLLWKLILDCEYVCWCKLLKKCFLSHEELFINSINFHILGFEIKVSRKHL